MEDVILLQEFHWEAFNLLIKLNRLSVTSVERYFLIVFVLSFNELILFFILDIITQSIGDHFMVLGNHFTDNQPSLFELYFSHFLVIERLKLSFRWNQAKQTISTGELHTLLHFYPQPINVVVFHGLSGKINLENCLALRCFQRLSVPHLATQPCSWQNNWSTRGASNPVLSY